MGSPAVELAHYLAAEGVTAPFGSNEVWSVHVSREPVAPAEVVTLYDTPGANAELIADELKVSGLQVRTRSRDYDEGYAHHVAIFRALAVPRERVIGLHRYVSIAPAGDILSLGRDENDRFLLTANYAVERHPFTEAPS